MRIKEFSILEYGPLPERGRIKLDNFNLFFGYNESGKTLTIDALIKLLVGKNVEYFRQLNRVEGRPEGFIILTDDGENEIKLRGIKKVDEILDISHSEFCNLFIIRDSDLNIHEEGTFYNTITDRLLGLRVNDIELIKENLSDLGKLTATGRFRNIKGEKFDDRISSAENCINEINELKKELIKLDFDFMDEKAIKIKEEVMRLNEKIENYENARKRELYEKSVVSINKLDESIKILKGLDNFNQNDKEIWRDCENNIRMLSDNEKDLLLKLEHNNARLNQLNTQLDIKEKESKLPLRIYNFLQEDIKPELKTYEIKKAELAGKTEKDKFFTLSFIITAALFGISLLGGMISSLIFGYFLAVFFASLVIVFFYYKYQFVRDKSWLKGFIERMRLKLSKFEFFGDNYDEISKKIEKFEEKYEIMKKEITRLLDQKVKIEDNIEKINNEELPRIKDKIQSNNNKIKDLCEKANAKNLKEYNEALLIKNENFNSFKTQKSILRNIFNFEVESDEEFILRCRNKIKSLEIYKEKNMELKYDDHEVLTLKDKIKKLKEDLEELNLKMQDIKKRLIDIERKANNILKDDNEYFHCNTSNDLDIINNRFNNFLMENNTKREDILKIINIFDEIEKEEKEKISKLLSKKSALSEYFEKITDGFYNKVVFEMESGKIKVNRRDNTLIDAEKISGGAFDQLYFSIRLALGEKIFQDKTGFFILDDPFLKSDARRLQRQIDMLKYISNLGWQILYFSSKNEIQNLFQDEIKKGSINYIQLEDLKI